MGQYEKIKTADEALYNCVTPLITSSNYWSYATITGSAKDSEKGLDKQPIEFSGENTKDEVFRKMLGIITKLKDELETATEETAAENTGGRRTRRKRNRRTRRKRNRKTRRGRK